MTYKKFSDEEILESYTTALDYSGKAGKDLLSEIENRGGIDQVKKNISDRNVVPHEIRRINKLIFSLYKSKQKLQKIRPLITSDILTDEQLDKIINAAIKNIEHHAHDLSINSRTIIGSIVGIVVSSLLGAGLWCYSIIQTGEMHYILTSLILIISYLIIRVLTRQSKNNALVFIATFVSAFMAIILGLCFLKYFEA